MADRETLFYEYPYACSLNDECLRDHCSNCFLKTTNPCPKCQCVMYCDDNCANNDSPLHQFECEVLPKKELPSDTRLVARFAIRQQKDGGVISLSKNFPPNIKDRSCKDLLSHFRDMKRDKKRHKRLGQFWLMCETAFADTSLASMKKADVQRLYCILCINTFGIFETNRIDSKRPWVVVGVGLYLNASRFNHSCSPTLFVEFNGNTMSVTKSYPNDDNAENRIVTEKELNRQTINYGVPSSDSHGAMIPMIKQRVESLRSRYYFKCRCPKCADRSAKRLEENAAAYECVKCRKPYVWRRRCTKLRPTCSCKKVPRINVTAEEWRLVKEIDAQWDSVLSEVAQESDADKIISLCEPLRRFANSYWHPVYNLRSGQLNERLFHAYFKRANDVDENDEKWRGYSMASIVGESMMASYTYRYSNDPQLALYYCRLATIYETLNDEESLEKAVEWYEKALRIYRGYKDETTVEIVSAWHRNAVDQKKKMASATVMM